MTQRHAVERLMAQWPQTDAWPRMAGEPYGPRWDDLDNVRPIERVLYAVTCTAEVEHLYRDSDYDLLVLHHPIRPIDPIPHVILHTPFDCGEGGLNDLWREALGIQDARHITDNLGWYGTLPTIAERAFRTRVRRIAGGRLDGQVRVTVPVVGSVAVCAGLGGWIADEVRGLDVSAFVTGELTQPADSLGIPIVLEVGHTRSERIGVQAIRRALPDLQVDVAPLGDDRFGNEIYTVNRGAL